MAFDEQLGAASTGEVTALEGYAAILVIGKAERYIKTKGLIQKCI